MQIGMKQTLLIPCYSLAGHHLEYITHFYNYALTDSSETKYIFFLVDEFREYLKCYKLKANIDVEYINTSDLVNLFRGNRYQQSFNRDRFTKKYIKKYNVTDVLYLAFEYNFLTQWFMTVKGVNYHGIIFQVYPYEYKTMRLRIKLHTIISHYASVHNASIKNIFIGNDEAGAAYLNKLYKTSKFKYIPDPFVPIVSSSNIPDILGSEKNNFNGKKVLFHFGAIRRSKGTIELLRAILITSPEITKRLCFVIAGKVPFDMKKEISDLINDCSQRTTIIFHDEFCSYDYIAAVCKYADYILMPYKHNSSSSGMYGYASQFGVPVVASNKGMTKKIVNKYKLGVLLDDISEVGISKFYSTIFERGKYYVGKRYCENNTVAKFNDAIFSSIIPGLSIR